jgi:nucleoside-diphosphate-sugar epimerase
MRVFVTGATGFIGAAVVRELVAAGHGVLGLARDAAKAEVLAATGAEAAMGTLEDTTRLAALAAQCDGVIHLAFNHDFSRFAENCALDRAAIDAMGGGLVGSGKPLIVTAGLAGLAPAGEIVTETHLTPADYAFPRQSEQAALALVPEGVRGIVLRLPQVHDTRRQGFVSYVIEVARAKGVLAYVGDGANRWPAAHVPDVARLYRLALEHAEAGAICHAVGEEGIAMRAICDALSRRLGLPTASLNAGEAAAHFGWLAGFVGTDMAASSAITREMLGWEPKGPGLLTDLEYLEI